MATLKDDDSSWRAQGIKRKDFRATKNGPDITGGPRRKKNKRKWCKGKVGVEHVVTGWKKNPKYSGLWQTKTCEVCGKELECRYKAFGLKYGDWDS